MTTDTLQSEAPGYELGMIRRALARRVRDTSQRQIAREVGISPTTLKDIVDGKSTPYGKTREKLAAWFTREGREAEATDVEARQVGIAITTRTLSPEALRERVGRLIARIVATPTPELLERVEAALEEPPEG